MNNISVTGTQNFMGIDIPVVEGGFGKDCRVITAKAVSDIHNTRLSDINASIKRLIKKKRIKEGVDYINLLSETTPLRDLAKELEMLSSNRVKNAFILSERGYFKLIKAMDTDKAWEVHDKLVDIYFSSQKQADKTNVDYYNLPLDKNAYVNSLVTQLCGTEDYKTEYDVFSSVYKAMREEYKVDVNEHKLLYSLQNPFEYNISTWKVVKHNPALYNLFVTVLNGLIKNTKALLA